jgi:hypothetical protein
MPTQVYKLSDGIKAPSVTTVISGNLGWNKQQLMYWSNKIGQEGKSHRDVSGAAADAGTLAHDMIECWLKGTEVDLGPWTIETIELASQSFENFRGWTETMKFEAIKTETPLVSENHKYGGTIDCIAKINNKLSLFDWKTSSGIYADYLIQVSAYLELYHECFPKEKLAGGYYLLRISKDTASWTLHHWDKLPEAWEAFKLLRKLHDLKKPLEALAK